MLGEWLCMLLARIGGSYMAHQVLDPIHMRHNQNISYCWQDSMIRKVSRKHKAQTTATNISPPAWARQGGGGG